ncbi:MAG: hypothetical protein IT292_09935 [Deltaproteobacteria bacterium]|nr:hypothetical protein [Deltaproteobacteria bacterium]
MSYLKKIATLLGDVERREMAKVKLKIDYPCPKFSQSALLSMHFVQLMAVYYELKRFDLCLEGMVDLKSYVNAGGYLSAFHNVSWVSTSGMALAVTLWLELSQREIAEKVFNVFYSLQNASGAWYGSYGVLADYYPAEELIEIAAHVLPVSLMMPVVNYSMAISDRMKEF